ncbi:MAG: hypothetical protein JHD16_06665, partial [Solirubrobacteraceae bacterium]|nr:hypothetical protein [Solirubrobacteraceae bacterium]
MQQTSSISSMQDLENRSDEELEKETRHRAAAQALLGARAAQRYDVARSKEHFQRAIAAARPQERMQIRKMADASIALAERRPDALKSAMERLGQEAPSGRQLFMLRVAGIVAPPKSAGMAARIRGILAVIAFILVLVAVSYGIVSLIAWPLGGASSAIRVFYAFLLIFVAMGVLFFVGRRKQRKARLAA